MQPAVRAGDGFQLVHDGDAQRHGEQVKHEHGVGAAQERQRFDQVERRKVPVVELVGHQGHDVDRVVPEPAADADAVHRQVTAVRCRADEERRRDPRRHDARPHEQEQVGGLDGQGPAGRKYVGRVVVFVVGGRLRIAAAAAAASARQEIERRQPQAVPDLRRARHHVVQLERDVRGVHHQQRVLGDHVQVVRATGHGDRVQRAEPDHVRGLNDRRRLEQVETAQPAAGRVEALVQSDEFHDRHVYHRPRPSVSAGTFGHNRALSAALNSLKTEHRIFSFSTPENTDYFIYRYYSMQSIQHFFSIGKRSLAVVEL